MRLFQIVICLAIGIAISGCGEVLKGLESRPTAIGSTNEIVVISDRTLWESVAGDSLVYYFEAPYPIMPQPEPMFDLRHFTAEDLAESPLRRELRTYIIFANLDDRTSPVTHIVTEDLGEESLRRAKEDDAYFTSVGMDKWARGQLIIYVFAYGVEELSRKIVKAYPAIAKRVQEHDLVQVQAMTYLHRESVPIAQRIREKFGVSLKVPGDFQIAVDNDNFLWIRQDTRDMVGGLALMRIPYSSTSQLELPGFIEMRDRLGMMIEGTSTGSYMQTNADDLPVYLYQKTLDGRFAVEGRGIWELTEDFLGGPFVCYAVVDSNEILMIDAFVHAPGKDKRNFVQRMEYVISSLRFD